MALVNKPDESIFASSAKQGEVDNFPDLLRGWGITFDQTQGIPPMEWFNFLFKRLDEKHAYLMQRGLPEWSATQDYTKGSCVQFDGLSYRALKAGKNNKPNESDSQYWVRWGFALTEIAHATLTQYGLTQLYTGYDSQREDLALTPKTAFLLKQLINSNTRALGNVILNSKKSDAVNSNSSDTVATSAAVKTAYDKGVDANSNANGRVSKNGDTMTGALTVPHIIVNDPTNNDNSVQIGDDAKFLDIDHDHSIGLQSLSDNTKGYIAYGSSKKKFGFDGYRFFAEGSIFTAQYGYGSFSAQYTSNAPYMVEDTNANQKDTYYPIVKGRFRKQGQYGTAVSFGYTTKQGNGDGFGTGITINLIEDNGAVKNWLFQHSGDFVSAGDVKSSSGKSLNTAVQFGDYRSQWQQNGWVRLPNGLILQWGKTPVIHDEHTLDIVFPIAFPNKVLNIQLTENQMRTYQAHATHLAALNITNTKFTLKMNSTLPIDTSADWFAIGY
uniref:Baseplate structural protein n=1 Tax=Myoviridae sp. ctKZW4 TaxID=2826639 RepID=A0A8S5NBR8_9CAUD|nr:MAG TPA: Baseplate structural protein [Myoviridae sp. ctKZW4]